MIRKILVATTAFCVLAIQSQAQRSTHIMVAASAAVPTGNFSDRVATSPGFLAGLVFGPNDSPFGGRIDVSHYQFNGRDSASGNLPDISTTNVTADVIATLTRGYAKPYLIAGFGWYSHRPSDGDKREHDWGLNAGVGLTFPFIIGGAFLEARYHQVNADGPGQRYIPISFGVIF